MRIPLNVRQAKWDNVKAFLMFCVVVGHVGNFFYEVSGVTAAVRFWIYLFHMPAFVFVTGMFSRRTILQRRYSKIFSYLLLYLFMEVLDLLAKMQIKGIGKVRVDFLHENGAPWFALAMVWFLLACMVLRNGNAKAILPVSVALGMAAGYFEKSDDLLALRRTIVYFPFFYVGFRTNYRRMTAFLDHRWIKIISQLVFLGSIVILVLFYPQIAQWRELFMGRFSYYEIRSGLSWQTGFLWRIGAYLISTVLMIAVMAVIPDIKTVMTGFGQRTLPVYALHYPLLRVLCAITPVYQYIAGSRTFLKCLCLAAVLMLTSLPVFEKAVRRLMHVPERVFGK